MERNIVIEHHADERRYAVTLDDYRSKSIDDAGHTYQQLGWRIVSWEGGEPYKPPSAASRSAERHEPEEPPRRERTATVRTTPAKEGMNDA